MVEEKPNKELRAVLINLGPRSEQGISFKATE
jgi:hypothetical protein